ncbi:MAG: hypothetical protein ACYC3L_14080 [Gemmatimonadaceae bacterium]
MIALQLTPVVLSLLVLGAHFLRPGNFIMVAVVVIVLGLLAVPRRWAARTVQAALLLAAVEWVRTLVVLYAERVQLGQPALRMCVILGSVALVTALSAAVFRTARLRAWYKA